MLLCDSGGRCAGESLVYLTAKELEFEIPFEEKKTSYNPKAFAGDIHYLYIRKARPEEWEGCRNLALNPMDQHGDRGCFPMPGPMWRHGGKRYLPRETPLTG